MFSLDELIIDPEFANLLPSLGSEEYEELENSILREGKVESPIIIWQGIIVDGHQRYDIIQKHLDQNIQYDINEKDFPNRAAALAWMYENQIGRRNINDYQKNYLIGKQYAAEKQAQGGTGANRFTNVQTGQNDQSVQKNIQTTAQRIAKEYGIGEKSVRRDEDIAKGVDLADETIPGTRQEILSGKIKPTYKEIKRLINLKEPEERKKLVEGFHADKKGEGKAEGPNNFPEYEVEKPVTDVTIQEVEEISARMESSNGQANEDEVIFELNDALETMIFRWKKCVEMNSEAARGISYCLRRDEIVKKGLDFLNNFKKRRKKET